MQKEVVTEDDIRARAYALWQGQGCPSGCELEHWLMAKKELNQQQGASRRADSTTPDKPVKTRRRQTQVQDKPAKTRRRTSKAEN